MRPFPLNITKANAYVAKRHRHSKPVQGAYFAVGVQRGGEPCGVAIVGRPIARNNDDGLTVEILRVCTDGTLHACSNLYGRCCRVARELGYQRILTYTLASEPGTSLRAAGFTVAAQVAAAKSWSVPSRPRADVIRSLFGDEAKRDTGPKVRWERKL